jgi:ribosomal protein S18 acetylase RimI-like enzyme
MCSDPDGTGNDRTVMIGKCSYGHQLRDACRQGRANATLRHTTMDHGSLDLAMGRNLDARRWLEEKLRDNNVAQTGAADDDWLELWLRDEHGSLVGGLAGWTWAGWLQIDLLWIDPRLRGRGHAARLLAAAEQEARARGCRRAVLDTFGFQAPELYRKLGYQVFGVLQDFPAGHTRYYLTKSLG